MKRLKAFRPGQERYEHNGRTFSIVDLCEWPDEGPQPEGSHWDEIMSHYKPFNFELADITKGVEIVERFTSFEEAKKAIREL